MAKHNYRIIIERIRRMDLFKICLIISFTLHISIYGVYFISTIPSLNADNNKIYEAKDLTFKDVDVDFIDLPASVLMGGSTNPAPVQKEEWIEGSGSDKPDAANTDVNINKLSGDGTDPDGYMFADLSDHPPIPILDFDTSEFFPEEARYANISRKTVEVKFQVNEDGTVNNVKVASSRIGYGFDEAAVKLGKRIRFRPGKIDGKPVKMTVRLPLTFTIEE